MGEHSQILGHGQIRENPSAFRNEANSGTSQSITAHAVDFTTADQELSTRGNDLTTANPKGRGLSCTVWTKQRVHLSSLKFEVDSVQHVDGSVATTDVVEFEDRGHDASTTVSVPRYAACTCAFACTSAGVPVAMIVPKSRT